MGSLFPNPSPEKNFLLAGLATATLTRLQPYLELVKLPQGKVIHEIGEISRYAYFPIDCIIAMLTISESGATTEVSMTGKEGMVGIALFLGGETLPRQAVVQNAGYAYRLPGKLLNQEFDRHGEMLNLLLRYTQGLITQTAQTAICYRHHNIEQQLCRMLLQSLDRLSGDELTVTHEIISNMLGVRRESVTQAAGKLKDLGMITSRRGNIKVLDRSGIEKLCCECYSVVKSETERLLPSPTLPPAAMCYSGKQRFPQQSPRFDTL